MEKNAKKKDFSRSLSYRLLPVHYFEYFIQDFLDYFLLVQIEVLIVRLAVHP